PVRVVADAVKVYPVPGLLMLTFAKVATPLTAATVVVPDRVPLAGLVPIATVMLVVAVVTVLPWASWTATRTAGVLAAPATALLGCTVKASFAPVGWTGPEVLPEHPPSATPHSATPSQNAQRRRGASDGSSCCWARGGLRRAIDRTLRDGGQSRHPSRPETQDR